MPQWVHLYVEATSSFNDDITVFSRVAHGQANTLGNMKGGIASLQVWGRAYSLAEGKSLGSQLLL